MNETTTFEVRLDIYEGPLDLLLYLVRKNNLEISDIPIARITAEYLQYLEMMKELNLDIAGEFLVMAATLLQIKARMLVPGASETEEVDEELDLLKQKLSEYQKYKEIAGVLSRKASDFAGYTWREFNPGFSEDDYSLEVSVFDLLQAFRQVLAELPQEVKEIIYEEIPIEEKIRQILDLLKEKSFITLSQLWRLQKSRLAMIVCFLAILELARLHQIVLRQKTFGGEIRIYRLDNYGNEHPQTN